MFRSVHAYIAAPLNCIQLLPYIFETRGFNLPDVCIPEHPLPSGLVLKLIISYQTANSLQIPL